MIQLENVSKIYKTAKGPVRALDHVALEVAAGEYVAVRGASGCGKSTLLMIIGALGRPTSGRVVVDKKDIVSMDGAARAQFRATEIGFVFQTFHLLPYLSVVENVLAAAVPTGADSARQRAVELLEKFQLGHRLTHRPGELSTGECQRVAMARAVINRPKLILADEPTGNLDPANAKEVLDWLDEFRNGGGTVLLVTHEEEAASRADRTVQLEHGRVVSPSAA